MMAAGSGSTGPRRIAIGSLTIEIEPAHERCFVRLEGELDMQSSPSLREELNALIDGEMPVVVDLRGLSFIDSSGIRCLTLAASRARDAGDGRMQVIRPPQGQVSQVLTLTNVGRYLPLIDG